MKGPRWVAEFRLGFQNWWQPRQQNQLARLTGPNALQTHAEPDSTGEPAALEHQFQRATSAAVIDSIQIRKVRAQLLARRKDMSGRKESVGYQPSGAGQSQDSPE
jgi:hypothetical protein